MSKRLAYLTSQYPAASHTFIRREVTALRALGWKIDTFSVRRPPPGEADNDADSPEAANTFYILGQSALAFAGAHIRALATRPLAYCRTFGLALHHRAPGLRGLLLSFAHFAEGILVAHELRRRKLSHLHNHFANSAATVGLLASRFLGIGWSFTMHGISETDYPAGLMLGRKIEASRLVACVSWFGRAQGMRLVQPQHWDKLQVVRCGIPHEQLPPATARVRTEKTIICVGRLSPEKGQAGLLRAIAEVRHNCPDLHLRLVGSGPSRESLEALAEQLDLSNLVTFAGRLSEKETLQEIARADMLVLPSFMEGLPIVLIEAMALGVPVISSRVAGVPELVEDGRTGLLFSPSNWDELAACIELNLKDGARAQAMAQAATEKIRSEFDAGRSAERLSRLFEQLQ